MKKFSFILAIIFLFTNIFTVGYAAEESSVFSDNFPSWNYNIPEGWSNSGNNSNYISCDTEYHTKGNFGVRVTDSSNTETAGIKSRTFSVTAGKTYKFVVNGYVHEGNMTPFLRFLDSSGKAISDIKNPVIDIGRWSCYNVSGIAPEGAVRGQIFLHQHKAATGTVTFDDVRVYEYNFKAPEQGNAVNSKILEPNGERLKYNTYKDEDGTHSRQNRLGDYSYAGYYAGEYEIPDTNSGSESLEVAITLSPNNWTKEEIADGTADDTERINDAIKSASDMLAEGKLSQYVKLAVVKLNPGNYYVRPNSKNNYNAAIQLKSNIILSGSGQGPTGTIIHAVGQRPVNDKGDLLNYMVVVVYGALQTTKVSVNIKDRYVPSGSKTFEVEDASAFKVGDVIGIHHPSTKEWDTMLGMSGMYYENGGTKTPTSWEGVVDMDTERVITEISGNKITVDFPFFVHLDNEIAQCTVSKRDDSKKIQNVGIENLRIQSDFDDTVFDNAGRFIDENHANIGIYFQGAKNCYVQDVTFKHIMHSAVNVTNHSKQITIRGCSSLEPVSQVAGSRRYTFACGANTQQILVNGCYSHQGRHDYETSFTATGPIAFVDNVADQGLSATETHGTWSTGVLYDNLMHIGNSSVGFIASTNRGHYGTGKSQGWSGAGVVVWNSLASTIMAHDVLGDYQNFLVGNFGTYKDSDSQKQKASHISGYESVFRINNGTLVLNSDNKVERIEGATIDVDGKIQNLTGTKYFATNVNTSFVGDSYKEAESNPVEPRSLFKAQLAERYTGTFRKGKPNAPVIVSPMPDDRTFGDAVDFQGLYQKGAEEVYVYVDNNRYSATLNEDNNTFSAVVSGMEDGVHKIYATQVIDGVEGNKTADRFIIVNNIEGYHQGYLSSGYSGKQLSVIYEDTRMTYDEYLDSLIIDELPEALDNITTVITGTQDGSSEITIKNQNNEEQTISGRYVLLPAKVVQKRGYAVPRYGYGFLISDDGENWSNEYPSALTLKNDAFGICFYNLAKNKTKYWFKQYVTYIDKDGEMYTIYSEPYFHEFK